MITRLEFLGAAQMVTGSCFFVQHGHTQLLVDCGLVQGPAEALVCNRAPFRFDPRELKYVILTHAHLDHSGLVPRLIAEGFRGRILSTGITKDLLRVVWEDYVHLHKTAREASGAAQLHGLYGDLEVEQALSRCEACVYDKEMTLSPSLRIRFQDAGHILGSAIVEMWVEDLKIVFSGDLGHKGKPIVRDPACIAEADVLVLESTYGDRNHKTMSETINELGRAISQTLSNGGSVVMPVYAIGRSQEVLYVIHELTRSGVLDRPKVFLDSPMAIQATDVYRRHLEAFDEEARKRLIHRRHNPRAPKVVLTETVAQSRIIPRAGSAIILAGSGMCEGGRIQDHLTRCLDDPRSCVIFTGYQVEGTVGRRLVDGATTVRLHGKTVDVKARIYTINGLSAHADQSGLLDWVGAFEKPRPRIFLVHGELRKMKVLARALEDRYGVNVVIPDHRQTVVLSDRPRDSGCFDSSLA